MRSIVLLFVQEAHKSIMKIQKHVRFHPVSCFSAPTKLAISRLLPVVENRKNYIILVVHAT